MVLPSLTEGQPLSILEALSYGMPVIATNVGGIPDIIVNKENGFLIAPKSASELSDRMAYFMDQPASISQISEKNSAIFEQRFTVQQYLSSTESWLIQ